MSVQPVFRIVCVVCVIHYASSITLAESLRRPNVLFIAMDDLNDWVGAMGGHPQTKTPNLDRLAASGVLFTNAHCTAPACNPSRTAIFTGRSPHKTGVYSNRQGMRDILPNAELIPKTFSRHGYHAAGSGKLLHYFIDAPSWDEYFPAAKTENPFPRTLQPKFRPVSLPRGGPWQYVETDWGPLDATDEEAGGDYLVTKWVSDQLAKPHEDKPFFLACGIYRPHEPWFVPKKYFAPFPLESIQLPPGYKTDDLEDVPEPGQSLARNRYFYSGGKEELYDTQNDPYEWTNLASNPEFDSRRERMRKLAPTDFATAPRPTLDVLTELKWNALKASELAPASKPDGNKFDVVFINRSELNVQLWWMDRSGTPRDYGVIQASKQFRQQTRPGAFWLIRDEAGGSLGFFRVDDRSAKAIVR